MFTETKTRLTDKAKGQSAISNQFYKQALELVRELSNGINFTQDLKNRNVVTKTFGNKTQMDILGARSSIEHYSCSNTLD